MAEYVRYMADKGDLAGSSISNYVWGFRTWLKFQRQLDPVYGIVDWEDFMQGVMVQTFVPSEPRKEVPLWLIRDALRQVDLNSFAEVQAAHLLLVLFFTFARSETPVALAHTGDNAFDPNKQVQVCDIRVEAGALWVRLKGIKQDLRMQRPEAAGNNDWIVIGDIPGSEFSILVWTQRLFAFHGQRREPKDAFYVNAARTKPYLYSAALKDVRRLLSKVVGDDVAKTYGLHGLRVAGYNAAKRGPEGEELAVAHGGWRSTAHRRYERFGDERSQAVVGLSAAMVATLEERDAGTPFPRVAAGSSSSSGLWPVGPPPPLSAPVELSTGPSSSGPTVIPRQTRVEVFWTDHQTWYAGTATSQRRVDGGLKLETRVAYDDVEQWKHYFTWHDMDDEHWRIVQS